MANPAESEVQNLLPVQAYFNTDGSFNTFIGQGVPFYATANPSQSGLTITNSTLNSSPIGNTSPSTGVFTNVATTTGTVSTTPANQYDLVNKAYVDATAQGLSFKQPALVASTANIPTLSGLLTIDGVTLVAGDRVLVKNQATQADNGIYVASASAWARAADANTWDELLAAYLFILEGDIWKGSAWVCTDVPGGTLGVTPVIFVQFSNNATYTAGTGLTLTGFQFSITNTGVSAATYGSATASAVLAINAQGQVTSASNTTITPAVGSITGLGTGVATWLATPSSANLAAAVSDETGTGALVFANSPTLVTPILGTPASGDFSTGTFTWPTFNQSTTGNAGSATNLTGGSSGAVPYQTASGSTTFLSAGTNGQVLTLASGVPSWATPTVGTVTSVSGTGTVNGLTLTGTVTSSGSLTLGGTLDLSSPPAIGGTTANTVRGTTVTATSSFVGTYFDASGSGGGSLRNASGTACLQWGGGGGANVTLDVSTNLNGSNAQIDISPTGTGHVHINPTGSGSVQIAPTSAGTMDNLVIGGTTPLAGTFTTLRINSTLSLAGSTGTSGYVLTSNGASAPTWSALPASTITITDDTSTNADRYITVTSATSGTVTGLNTVSTKLKVNPSTGAFTATSLTPTNAVGVAYGGTGNTSATAYAVQCGGTTSTGAFQSVSGVGTSGQVLTSAGAGALPTWQTPGGGFAAGTAILFYQAAAPTGWTKSVTNDNKALRVVSGATGGSAGGSVAFTTAFASQTPAGSVSTSISAVSGSVGISGGSVGAYTLATTDIPSHTHSGGLSFGNSAQYAQTNNNLPQSTNTGSTGGGGSHSHSFSAPTGSFTFSSGTASSSFTGTAINLAVQYIDVIVCTKD